MRPRPFALAFALALPLASCAEPRPPASAPPPANLPAPAPPPATATSPSVAAPAQAPVEDPFLWLEDIEAERSLAWVRERNEKSRAALETDPSFQALERRLLAIYASKERIPMPEVRGKYIYNFWRDDEHPLGLWRRTSLAEYKKASPAWEIVLDLDALAAEEKERWVWHGAHCLYPKYERCLLELSRGGSDAAVVREFDAVKKTFVPATSGGFALPEAKSDVAWVDGDTVTVGTKFDADALTESGYPRIVKLWKRGTPIESAKTIFEASKNDVSAFATRVWERGRAWDIAGRNLGGKRTEIFLREGDRLERIDKPEDASFSVWGDLAVLRLRSDWVLGAKTYRAGSLLATPIAAYRAGKRDFDVLVEPAPNRSLASFAWTKNALLVVELEDVKSVLSVHRRTPKGWTKARVPMASASTINAWAFDADVNDDFFLTTNDFLTPTGLELGTVGKEKRERIKAAPAFFDAKGLAVSQHFVASKDGTRVPYFLVAREGLTLDGSTPTLLYGYGGFEISQRPAYRAGDGAAWLERGGALAIANIRGGGEYGPGWHQAALKHDRQRAYDDFVAIAEDLVSRKVTSRDKLGIYGGSNGGLLMGVMMTQRPDLFRAIVSQVPLLDMKRFHRLLAGASWMGEYGDPEKADDLEAILRYSPYQNLREGVRYPRTLFTTSTRDDRVHPGHARKMVARLEALGQDVLYYENIEGGHGGAADLAQAAHLSALLYTFFRRELDLR